MTLGEFKAWLDGYLEAGGTDVSVIKAKLDETPVYASPAIPPYNPNYPDTGRWPYSVTSKMEAVA